MKSTIFIIGGIFIIISSCFAGLFGGYIGTQLTTNGLIFEPNNTVSQEVRVTNEESAVIDVVNAATSSVVSIVISKDLPKYYNSPFYEFYNDSSLEGTTLQQIGAGSGFVVDSNGMIITNRHVVEDEDASYTVVFNDGTQAEATVLAKDTILDIAFIKVSDVDVTPLKLGTSSELKVGQTVIAIGNALGEFSNTVSTGIISGLSRDIVASDAYGASSEELDDLIQTDASINPGNSGGPLLDINGNVIGVNVAVADAENIGFAIPIDIVNDLISRLNDKGEIERPVLGVRYTMIDEAIQEENDLAVDYGALIVSGNRKSELAVIPGGAADKAGLVENDIILEIEGTKLDGTNTLQKVIQQYKVGDTITLKVLSKGVEKDVEATLQRA